jgi:lon-related putative ATP-dependent protease
VTEPVPAELLRRAADFSRFAFETTDQLEPVGGLVGQDRACDAIRLGASVAKSGFNLFAIGPEEARMREAVRQLLDEAAPTRTAPGDWVYVNNFSDARRPSAIGLPAGSAPRFQGAMHELIVDLKAALPAAFEGEDYQNQHAAIEAAFQKDQGQAFAELEQKAAGQGIVLMRTQNGLGLAPLRNGKVVTPEEFSGWPEADRRKAQSDIEGLEEQLQHVLRHLPQREKVRREALRQLNRRTAELAVGHLVEEMRPELQESPALLGHLDRVKADLVDNVAMFIAGGEAGAPASDMILGGPFDRYEVNVLVTQAEPGHIPVVEEPHPTLSALTGSIEHLAQQGALVTNFRLIKAGALHRANGGYLLLDARHLLNEPFSWPTLKRVLRRGEIVIEDANRLLGVASTLTLEPDPIPLDVKVVLFGDRLLYFMLAGSDPELGEHFKVLADFDDDWERSGDSEALLARLIATLLRDEGLKAADRGAVALLIEQAARLAGDSGKLTLRISQIRDLLAEADHWASDAGRKVIGRSDVERALAERIRRNARLRDRTAESILEEVSLIATSGARVGEINGLSVIEMGDFAFGRPTRISCQARPGGGRVIDIEREVELGGPLHSKGVMILSGFLAGRFALDGPMSLTASLVFEQSYSGVEGDSASSAELYALISSIADLPLRQDLAVTGSVNQHGEVQAIGGVNEKIEGFFDICAARGLTGTQGVVIPKSNLRHLMLRPDVVQACAEGRFGVYPVSTIDEGLNLLTGKEAGVRAADGSYPEGTINRLVEDRLRRFAEVVRRAFPVEPSPRPA